MARLASNASFADSDGVSTWPATLWETVSTFVQSLTGIPPLLLARLFWTLAVWLAFLGVRAILSDVVERRVRDVARQYVATKTLNYALSFVALVLVLRVWLGGVTGLAAYFGIVSAGLAIALQDPLINLAGWVFIVTRKPFVVGDRIQIGDHAGDVIDIRPFQFSLIEIGRWVDAEQSTGRIIHVPNGWTFKQSTANYSQGFNFIWNELPVTVTYESNWRKAKELLHTIAARHTPIRSETAAEEIRRAARKYMIFFQHLTPIVWTSVADMGVTLTVRYLCEPRKRRSSATAIWEDVLTEFAAADDIDFAYPTTRFYDNATEGKPGARAAAAAEPQA